MIHVLIVDNIRLASTTLPEDGAYRLTQTISEGRYGARVLIVGLAETNKAIIR